jgi:hypothetical protein
MCTGYVIVNERNKRLRQASNIYERTSPRGCDSKFSLPWGKPHTAKRKDLKRENWGKPHIAKKRKEIKEIENLSIHSIVFRSVMFS